MVRGSPTSAHFDRPSTSGAARGHNDVIVVLDVLSVAMCGGWVEGTAIFFLGGRTANTTVKVVRNRWEEPLHPNLLKSTEGGSKRPLVVRRIGNPSTLTQSVTGCIKKAGRTFATINLLVTNSVW